MDVKLCLFCFENEILPLQRFCPACWKKIQENLYPTKKELTISVKSDKIITEE